MTNTLSKNNLRVFQRQYCYVLQLTELNDYLPVARYVRLNRARLRGELGLQECQDSLYTLYTVLLTLNRLMAPFTPFISG